MKLKEKVIVAIVALGFLLGGATGFAAKEDIMCACGGCNLKAVDCGCPTAKKQLKGL